MPSFLLQGYCKSVTDVPSFLKEPISPGSSCFSFSMCTRSFGRYLSTAQLIRRTEPYAPSWSFDRVGDFPLSPSSYAWHRTEACPGSHPGDILFGLLAFRFEHWAAITEARNTLPLQDSRGVVYSADGGWKIRLGFACRPLLICESRFLRFWRMSIGPFPYLQCR